MVAGNASKVNVFAPRASVSRLTMSNFRCYKSQRMEVGPGPVVLNGPNGAGKTNVLEALSFLVPGRGLRGVKLAEISRRDPQSKEPSNRQWAVAAHLETKNGPRTVGTGREIQPGARREKRIVLVDGGTMRSQTALGEILSAQWLTPQMDRLFLEGASARRRFLDRLVFGIDPAHAGRVSAYEHAMRERSQLLRHGQPDSNLVADPEWLSILEKTMASKGVAVSAARIEVATKLDQLAGKRAQEGIFPSASISVKGTLEDWLDGAPALEAEDRMEKLLKDNRQSDRDNGSAQIGPHRSDMLVSHLGTGQIAKLCSTGEQKALLISLILANTELSAAQSGSLPLLLLDEVAAHLDEARREDLFAEIIKLGIQAWMTGTDVGLFSSIKKEAQFFSVKNAAIMPI
jgi:DNA replication and repair protein RecF